MVNLVTPTDRWQEGRPANGRWQENSALLCSDAVDRWPPVHLDATADTCGQVDGDTPLYPSGRGTQGAHDVEQTGLTHVVETRAHHRPQARPKPRRKIFFRRDGFIIRILCGHTGNLPSYRGSARRSPRHEPKALCLFFTVTLPAVYQVSRNVTLVTSCADRGFAHKLQIALLDSGARWVAARAGPQAAPQQGLGSSGDQPSGGWQVIAMLCSHSLGRG